MHWIRNLEVENELLSMVREEYMAEPRTGIHLTSLIGCLTRMSYEEHVPLEVTRKELLLFSIGFGLERVFITRERPTVEVLDGISMTPDYISLSGLGVDLKSTRMRPTADGSPTYGWSEGWQKQFMAYAKVRGVLQWTVAPLYLGVPDLVAGTMFFTEEEVENNWQWLLGRKAAHLKHNEDGNLPTPYQWNESWECANCRYSARCKMITDKMKSQKLEVMKL
jgi:hypothetical protein